VVAVRQVVGRVGVLGRQAAVVVAPLWFRRQPPAVQRSGTLEYMMIKKSSDQESLLRHVSRLTLLFTPFTIWQRCQ
jgi:hypothetical protein